MATVGGVRARSMTTASTPVPDSLHLRLAGPTSPVTTLDPALVRDSETMTIVRQLFRGLMAFDKNLALHPELADALSYDASTLTYTATLRQGIAFHDGRPIAAADVERSFVRALDPMTAGGDRSALAASGQLVGIVGAKELLAGTTTVLRGVQVLDDRTIAIRLVEPDSAFPGKLASVAASIVDATGDDPSRDISLNGSGPFQRLSSASSSVLTLTTSSVWHKGHSTVRSLSFLTGGDASTPSNLLQRGDIDIASGLSAADGRLLADPASGSGALEIIAMPSFSLLYLALGSLQPPLDDLHIRKAVQYGFPWRRLAEASSSNVAIADGVIPPGVLGRSWPANLPNYDPERAMSEIAASRYGRVEDIPPITVYTGQTSLADPLRNVGSAMQEELGNTLGLRIDPVSVAWGDFLNGLSAGRFPTYSLTWVADYPDPSAFLRVLFGSGSPDNYSGYRSEQFDALLALALAAADDEMRVDAYSRAQQMLIDDAVIMPISFDIGYTAYRTGIAGVPVSPIGLVGLETIVGA